MLITTVLPTVVVSPYDGRLSSIVRVNHLYDHMIPYHRDHHISAVGQQFSHYYTQVSRLLQCTITDNCPLCGGLLHHTPVSVHCYNFQCSARAPSLLDQQLALLGIDAAAQRRIGSSACTIADYLDDPSDIGVAVRMSLRDHLRYPDIIPFLGLNHLIPDLDDQPQYVGMSLAEFYAQVISGRLYLPYVAPPVYDAVKIVCTVNGAVLDRLIRA